MNRAAEEHEDVAQPRIFIGMPVYNAADKLAEAVEAILAQTMGDFVLQISDNASTDGTFEIARKYAEKDERVSAFRYEENLGATRNFNRLAEAAGCEYFAWAAGDDRMAPEYLERCREALDADDGAVLAYAWVKIVDPEGGVQKIYRDGRVADSEDVVERLRAAMYHLQLLNCFYGVMRRRALQATQLMRDDMYAPDNLLIVELAMEGRFVQIEEPLFRRGLPGRGEHVFQRYERLDRTMFRQDRRYTQRTPMCHFVKCHIDSIRHSRLSPEQKAELIGEMPGSMIQRWGGQMKAELDRAIHVCLAGKFGLRWGENPDTPHEETREQTLQFYEVEDMLRDLTEARLVFQDYPGLQLARAVCLARLARKAEAIVACLHEYRRRPEMPGCRDLARQLGCLTPDEQIVVPLQAL